MGLMWKLLVIFHSVFNLFLAYMLLFPRALPVPFGYESIYLVSKLNFPTYLCISEGRKCWFFKIFYIRTKGMVPLSMTLLTDINLVMTNARSTGKMLMVSLREKCPNTGFFRFVFSCIWNEYSVSRSKSPYSVQIQGNTGHKKLRVWTIFTQCFEVKLIGSLIRLLLVTM